MRNHAITNHPLGLVTLLALALVAVALAAGHPFARKSPARPASTRPMLHRGAHVSAGLQPFALAGPPKKARPARSGIVSCRRPGPLNHVANCKSDERPAIEPWIVARGALLYAAAGDYDTWNGQVGLGFYWSRDGRTWFDGGPLDLFPHDDPQSGSGDPQLAVDAKGVVYYSAARFSFVDCSVGGIELARRDPVSGTWRVAEIAGNSTNALQDRPALSISASSVYVAWTQFDSCSGEDDPSHLRVAVLATGSKAASATILEVPGSRFSQGAAIGADPGGFWIAWEEFPDASADEGWIELARWSRGGGWNAPRTISPPGFRDLPSPIPGFRFATNSTPALALVSGTPWVAWASADTGVGRVYLWSPSGLRPVDDRGGDQLLPALAGDAHGGVAVSFSRADRTRRTLVRLLSRNGHTRLLSSKPSSPNREVFFSGRFIGDYAGTTLYGREPMSIWTDLRGSLSGTGAATAMTAR